MNAQCIRRTVTSYLETGSRLVYKRVHTADKTGQNCSVSNIFRTVENCPRLSRTHFTPQTRTRQLRLLKSCPRLRCELGITVFYWLPHIAVLSQIDYNGVCTVSARYKATSDQVRAKKFGRISRISSTLGMVTSVFVGLVLFFLFLFIRTQTDELQRPCPTNISYERSCYNYATYVGPSGSCYGGVKSPDDYCYSNDCYYHTYRTSCYKYRTYVGNSSSCPGEFTSDTGYCYSANWSFYEYADICYRFNKYVNSSDSCAGVRSPDNYCYTACPDDMYTYLGSCYDAKPYRA